MCTMHCTLSSDGGSTGWARSLVHTDTLGSHNVIPTMSYNSTGQCIHWLLLFSSLLHEHVKFSGMAHANYTRKLLLTIGSSSNPTPQQRITCRMSSAQNSPIKQHESFNKSALMSIAKSRAGIHLWHWVYTHHDGYRSYYYLILPFLSILFLFDHPNLISAWANYHFIDLKQTVISCHLLSSTMLDPHIGINEFYFVYTPKTFVVWWSLKAWTSTCTCVAISDCSTCSWHFWHCNE